ncbi:MAG: hypothetical protein Q4C49_00635 [Bacillota bacterium]|nr:hypothetical protein [Bacillota bacterium]
MAGCIYTLPNNSTIEGRSIAEIRDKVIMAVNNQGVGSARANFL